MDSCADFALADTDSPCICSLSMLGFHAIRVRLLIFCLTPFAFSDGEPRAVSVCLWLCAWLGSGLIVVVICFDWWGFVFVVTRADGTSLADFDFNRKIRFDWLGTCHVFFVTNHGFICGQVSYLHAASLTNHFSKSIKRLTPCTVESWRAFQHSRVSIRWLPNWIWPAWFDLYGEPTDWIQCPRR